MQPVPFRKLADGTLFDFDRAGLTPGHGLAAGPWRKAGRRTGHLVRSMRQREFSVYCEAV